MNVIAMSIGDDAFTVGIGAEAVRDMLKAQLDLPREEREQDARSISSRRPPRPSARSWSSG